VKKMVLNMRPMVAPAASTSSLRCASLLPISRTLSWSAGTRKSLRV
jgi:hypothetical protein